MRSIFKDKTLHLTVLDEIRGSDEWLQEVQSDYLRERATHPDWPTWEVIEANDSEELAGLEEFLLGLPLPADQLDLVSSLVIDGDRDIYSWIFPNWHDTGPDDDFFIVHDLTGIDRCSNLEELELGQGMAQGCSMLPLLGLKKLRKVSFTATGDHKDVGALLDCPSLRELDVFDDLSTHADWPLWRDVARTLAAR